MEFPEEELLAPGHRGCAGCGAAIATSSMATELIKGKTIQEALKLTNKAVVEALEGLPPVKLHCSVLAEEAVRAAILDYLKKNGREDEFEISNTLQVVWDLISRTNKYIDETAPWVLAKEEDKTKWEKRERRVVPGWKEKESGIFHKNG